MSSPEHGGRLELKLVSLSSEAASYSVVLSAPVGEWTRSVRVPLGTGEPEFAPAPGEADPPEWLQAFSRAVLRTLWRSHPQSGWPRRVTRWRPAPGADSPP